MPNTIEKITKYLPLFDETVKLGDLTRDLVDLNKLDFTGANKVKVFKVTVGNPSSYNRSVGYNKKADANASWEEFTMAQDRYTKIGIDTMDNEETQDMTNKGTLVELAKKAKEEIDFYRFGKLATTNGIQSCVAALANGSAVLNAISMAEAAIDDEKFPATGRILYITSTKYQMLKQELGEKSGRFTLGVNGIDRDFEYFDNMKVVRVPQSEFKVGTQYNATSEVIEPLVTNNKTQDINFMIVCKEACNAAVKIFNTKFIPEKFNSEAREDVFVENHYHDIFVFDNKKKGIYGHFGVAA